MGEAILEGSEKRPALFLGYGEGDPFAPANRLLAQALPVECVLRSVPRRWPWAQPLRRVFAIEVLVCPAAAARAGSSAR